LLQDFDEAHLVAVGAKDVVKQGLNGFVVDNDRHEEQISHALEVLSNRTIRNIMSKEARKTASGYGWDASLEKYLECYCQSRNHRNRNKHAMATKNAFFIE